MTDNKISIPLESIQQKIYLIRGVKVMLDRDLALFYKVRTKELNKAVSRNCKLPLFQKHGESVFEDPRQ